MIKSDKVKKVFGLILILAIVVSVFGGVVSAEDVSGGLKQNVDAAEIQTPVGNLSSEELAEAFDAVTDDTVNIEFADQSSRSSYDRQAAYNYAQKYWNKVCSDGCFWDQSYPPTCGLTPGASLGLREESGVDCAHFVSCCIGNEPNEKGGGLDVDTRVPPAYGEPGAQRLRDWLLNNDVAEEVSSLSQVEKGDVIFYDLRGTDNVDHSAFYLGNGKIATHSWSYWNVNWDIYDGYHDKFNPKFIHISTQPVQKPTVETRSATSITETAATLNGEITDDGGASIDERRFSWGTTSSCSDDWITDDPSSDHYGYFDISGNSFRYRLTGLESDKTYYFQAWAHNSAEWNNGAALSFTTLPQNQPPIASASDISNQPDVMQPDTLYEVTAKYYDPDGRTNLYLCTLGLSHPSDDIMMGWGEDLKLPVETSEFINDGDLAVDYTPITDSYEGYQLTWKFKLNDQWPETENCIDFCVLAIDDDDLRSGLLPDCDNTDASFVVPERTITFYTDPAAGGTLTFDGSTYSNGQSTTKTDATYSVSANPASNYVFDHWSTTGSVSVANPNAQSTTATVSGDGTIKAWFNYIPPERTITFYTDPAAGGTLTFDGSTYSNGQSTTKTDATYSVSANPASNYVFDHWSTTGSVSVANPNAQSSTATVSGDGTIKAWFNYIPPERTITFYTDPAAGGTLTFDGSTYSNGQSTTKTDATYSVSANPASDYAFDHWSTTGSVSVANTYSQSSTATVSGDGTIKAWFNYIPPERTITFYMDPAAGGTLTFDGSIYSNGQSTTKTDATYSVSANPASNYAFDHWSTTGSVSVANPNSQSTTATVSGDGSIKAWFNYIPPERTITFYTDPAAGGTLTFDGSTYSNGQSTTKTDATYSVSANPASDYAFDHWSTTGSVSVANPNAQSTTATVSGDGTIKAWFNYIPPERTITFYMDPAAGGTLTFDGSIYSNGQSTTKTDATYAVSANPASNYAFDHWSTTGSVSVANPNSQSTTATVSGDGSIKAWFNYIPPERTITFYMDPAAGGTLTFDGSIYSNGQSTTKTDATYSVSANPASNYAFDHWSTTGGVSVANPNSQSTTATVSGDGTIKAWFNYIVAETEVSIEDASAPQGGTVTVPINIAGVENICGASIWLNYNKDVVIVDSVSDGTLVPLTHNIDNTAGVTKINWDTTSGMTGDFVFAYVTLKAVGNPGDTCLLDLDVNELYDCDLVEIPRTVVDGTFEVIAPLMEGDVTDLNVCVSLKDSTLIKFYLVDMATLTPDQLECADTNDDGEVTLKDSTAIKFWLVDQYPLWESPADDHMMEPVPCSAMSLARVTSATESIEDASVPVESSLLFVAAGEPIEKKKACSGYP